MDAGVLLKRLARVWRGDGGGLAAEARLFAELLAQPDAERVLVEAVGVARSVFTRSVLLGYLGKAQGPLGVEVLRSHTQASGPGSRDVRGAALHGLTVRLGAASTPDLRAALRHRDAWTRVDAMDGLLTVGDDSAWDDAFSVWSGWVRTGRRLWDDPEGSVAVHLLYLLRGVEPASERLAQVVETVRARQPVIDMGWYERFWREALRDGPSPEDVPLPDLTRVLRWYLVLYARWTEPPSAGLRFRVVHSHKLHGRGPTAIGEILAGSTDVWQDDRKRLISVDGSRRRAYVGVGAGTVGGVEYSLLSLPYEDDLVLSPGSLVEVVDEG